MSHVVVTCDYHHGSYSTICGMVFVIDHNMLYIRRIESFEACSIQFVLRFSSRWIDRANIAEAVAWNKKRGFIFT